MSSPTQQTFDLVEHRRVGLVGIAAIHLAWQRSGESVAGGRSWRGPAPATCACAAGDRRRNRTCRASPARDGAAGNSAPRSCASRPRFQGRPRAHSRDGAKMIGDAFQCARDRVQAATLAAASRQGDIDPLGRELRGECRILQYRPAHGYVARSVHPRARLTSAPRTLRASAVIAPSALSSAVTRPLLPSRATRRASSVSRSATAAISQPGPARCGY